MDERNLAPADDRASLEAEAEALRRLIAARKKMITDRIDLLKKLAGLADG